MTEANRETHPLSSALAAPMAAAFDSLDAVRSVTMSLSRMLGGVVEPGSAAFEPLSKLRSWVLSERASLVAVMQSRDSIEQRNSHILAVLDRVTHADHAHRGWAECVVAAQLHGIADLLVATAQTGEKALTAAQGHLISAGEAYAPAGALDLVQGGLATVRSLLVTAGQIEQLADGAVPPSQPINTVDLGWISALYTMDGERDIHARVARLGFAPRVALSA